MKNYPEVLAVFKSHKYYKNGKVSSRTGIINTVSTLFLVDSMISGSSGGYHEIVSIPGQGSFILVRNLDDKFPETRESSNVLDYDIPVYSKFTESPIENKSLQLYQNYLYCESIRDNKLVLVKYSDIDDDELFRIL